MSFILSMNKYAYKHNSKVRALEPQKMLCLLINKEVSVLLEYSDYKNRNNKGAVGTVYCENIIDCFHNKRHCKYSGISPSYADPLVPLPKSDNVNQ